MVERLKIIKYKSDYFSHFDKPIISPHFLIALEIFRFDRDAYPKLSEILCLIFYFPNLGEIFPKEKIISENILSLKLPNDILNNFFPMGEKYLSEMK